MIRPVAVLVGVSLLAGLATAGPMGLLFGPAHWTCAAVGFGLAVPAAAATLGMTVWLARHYRFGMVLGLVAGPMVRAAAVLGLAGGLFLAARARPEEWAALGHPLVYWLWVLFAYLETLAAETALLARPAKGK